MRHVWRNVEMLSIGCVKNSNIWLPKFTIEQLIEIWCWSFWPTFYFSAPLNSKRFDHFISWGRCGHILCGVNYIAYNLTGDFWSNFCIHAQFWSNLIFVCTFCEQTWFVINVEWIKENCNWGRNNINLPFWRYRKLRFLNSRDRF